MSDQVTRKGLGRGLSALIGDAPMAIGDAPVASVVPTDSDESGGVRTIAVDLIAPNPKQPRKAFTEEQLEELTRSIIEKGVLQPIILRPAASGEGYQIVAGERRWRAAQRARLHEIPAMVRDFDDREVIEIAIIENIQRADLNPIEEASGYHRLVEDHGYTQEQLARVVGKSRSHVANMMRLLNLPEAVREHLISARLTPGHARALLAAEDPERLAAVVVDRQMNVRDTEKLVKNGANGAQDRRAHDGGPGGGSGAGAGAGGGAYRNGAGGASSRGKAQAAGEKDTDTQRLEGDLSAALGVTVSIEHAGDGGRLLLRYQTLDQLDDICRRLSQPPDAFSDL